MLTARKVLLKTTRRTGRRRQTKNCISYDYIFYYNSFSPAPVSLQHLLQ